MTDPRAIVITSVVVAAVAGSVLAVALSFIRSRSECVFARRLCSAAGLAVVFGMPWLTDFLLLRLNVTNGTTRSYIHLGRPGLLLPAAIVLGVSIVAAWRFDRAA